MPILTEALDKIRSSELRRDALAVDDALHTVLVEIEAPRLQVIRSARPSIVPGYPSPRIAGSGEEEFQVRATRQAIEEALGRAAERYLPSAHVFVVKATGLELRRISGIPSVQAIWLNTRRRQNDS
jgi:nucleoside-diphosphate-sugar epimerase